MEPKIKNNTFFITKEEEERQDNEVPFGLPKDAGLPTRKQFRESEQDWVKLSRKIAGLPHQEQE